MAQKKELKKNKWFIEGPFYRYVGGTKAVKKMAYQAEVQIIDIRRSSDEMIEAVQAPQGVIDGLNKQLKLQDQYTPEAIAKKATAALSIGVAGSPDVRKLQEQIQMAQNEKGVAESRAKMAEEKVTEANESAKTSLELAEKSAKETDALKLRIAELEKKK